MNHAGVVCMLVLAAALGACEDQAEPVSLDGEMPQDGGALDGAMDLPADGPPAIAADSAQDVRGDLAGDLPGDGAAGPDGSASPDGAVDTTPVGPQDSGPDGPRPPDGAPVFDAAPVPDGTPPTVWGRVSRSVAPALNAKGPLYIGLYNPQMPPPAFWVSGRVVQDATLPLVTSTVSYELFNVPKGEYLLWAFLDDNNNVMLPWLPMADGLDLVMSQPMTVTVDGTGQRVDLVLDKLEQGQPDGGIGDAAIETGALTGTVTATVVPSQDGKGRIFVSLFSKPPPQGLLGSFPVNAADLSSPFGAERYFIGQLQPGNYYLQAFLDDNGNAGLFTQLPDKGDMVNAQPLQVRVVAGTVGIYDVVLDQIK